MVSWRKWPVSSSLRRMRSGSGCIVVFRLSRMALIVRGWRERGRPRPSMGCASTVTSTRG
jgi:hypothetical protein